MLQLFRPIERGARGALLSGSLVVALGAMLAVPLAGSTTGHRLRLSQKGLQVETVRRDDPWKTALVKVSRDPFLPVSAVMKAPVSPARPDRGNAVDIQLSQAQVRGLAFGQKPKAVVEVEGVTKIVAPGDLINGARVASILPDRVVLSNGSVLMFSRRLP